ncbi:hypothetical protein M433DRAFT_7961 [Acidomyces richmondensis BFW]|nr:MAG: hypothetical protein FE78DRAFT_27292 [Acidomyces sp. 'richmondensis']KYG41434.1 hypothetical protein M433DRAFT_7961 [Acidomyces richmondensis BFW]
MNERENGSRGIFALPNEILLSIFDTFSTPRLLPFAPTCRQFYFLIVRILQHRLQVAAGLNGHTLYLECHPPSARSTATKFFCTSLGTDGLQELIGEVDASGGNLGQLHRMRSLFSRFRPQRKEPDVQNQSRAPPGDISGSQNYRHQNIGATGELEPPDIVSETVTVDASDLFTQLTAQAYLGKRERTRGLLFVIQEVTEGTVRVWREWLSRRCEGRTWTDGEAIVVHHDPPTCTDESKGNKTAHSSVTVPIDLTKDEGILWINTRQPLVGIKMRVKKRKPWRTVNPLIYSSDIDIPVSFDVDFEEVLVRTTHLLLMLEESQRQITDSTGKAIVFGSYAGPRVFDTVGQMA